MIALPGGAMGRPGRDCQAGRGRARIQKGGDCSGLPARRLQGWPHRGCQHRHMDDTSWPGETEMTGRSFRLPGRPRFGLVTGGGHHRKWIRLKLGRGRHADLFRTNGPKAWLAQEGNRSELAGLLQSRPGLGSGIGAPVVGHRHSPLGKISRIIAVSEDG